VIFVRRWIFQYPLACLLILFAVGVAGFWLARPQGPSARLADGSTVRLERILLEPASTPNRTFRWWDKLREEIRRRLALPNFSRRLRSDSLVVWLSRRDRESGRHIDFEGLAKLTAVDRHGCEFELGRPALMVHTQNS
jgi:hypothetical protein